MESTSGVPIIAAVEQLFGWPEYLVFGSVLAASVAIGIFFGCFGSKNSTNAEYLHGNKQMHPIPVALSLLCSYVSSITLLGHPVEIYLFGTQLMFILVSYLPLTLSLIYIYVPFFFSLQVTSVFEYLEMRFSRLSRYFLSIVNVVYSIFYMALVVYGPALALSQVTGLRHELLVAIIFAVCIFYSSIGGIKAVLWTDSLQAFIMLASMVAVVSMGIANVGGMSLVWERVSASGRVSFFNFDPDPRTRHTFWTSLIGGYFSWLPSYANQSQVQRYISLPSIRAAKQALIINLFGLWIIMGLCYVTGLVIYATYHDCDPLTNGEIATIDQLLPKFVMDTLTFPGLPGLFVAGITCAALSTVSSVVNALAATVVEDGIKNFDSNISETKLNIYSKIVSAVSGLLGFGFVFIVEYMGSIYSAASTVLGILGGPTFGLFLAGMFFPWANSWGSTTGMLLTTAFMAFIGFGSRYYSAYLPIQNLVLDISGCPEMSRVTDASFMRNVSIPQITHNWKDQNYTGLIQFFSMSDLWYPTVGTVLTVALALLCSFFVTYVLKKKSEKVPSKLFAPLILKMWMKICPGQIQKLVDFSDQDDQDQKKHKTGLEDVKGQVIEECFPEKKLQNPDSVVAFISTDSRFNEPNILEFKGKQ